MQVNKNQLFPPGRWQQINNFVVTLSAIIVTAGLIYLLMRLSLRSVQVTLSLVSYLFFIILPAFICIPLTNGTFTLTINQDFIRCPSSPIPFASNQVQIPWNVIHTVEIGFVFMARFYILKDKMERTIGYVPFDLENYAQLKNLIKTIPAKENPLVLLLTNEERLYGFFQFPLLKVEPEELVIVGVLQREFGPGNVEFLPQQKVELLWNKSRMATLMTNQKGEFFYSFNSFPGNYELLIKFSFYESLHQIKLPMASNSKFTITVRPPR